MNTSETNLNTNFDYYHTNESEIFVVDNGYMNIKDGETRRTVKNLIKFSKSKKIAHMNTMRLETLAGIQVLKSNGPDS